MRPNVDVAILGGGCAGLSLAAALSQQRSSLRVQVLEERSEYIRDRTWCLWNTEPHPFEQCVTHRWGKWQVGNKGCVVTQASKRYQYQHIPSDRFYEAALRGIDRDRTQQLCRGVEVKNVWGTEGAYRIETSAGMLTARHLFDSRPPGPAGTSTGLVQRFTGWHVRMSRPVFDASTVELMCFQPITVPGRLLFFYVLPFASDEAMVEATSLDAADLSAADLEPSLRAWLDQASADCTYTILFREHGALPMSSAPAPLTPGHSIGIRGGRIKASSGYAFLRIQRQSRIFAQALIAGHPMPRRIESSHYASLDRVFLQALCLHPESAADYFVRLFERVPPDRLVRFLSESGTVKESLFVALALPSLPFIKAAISTTHGRL